MIKYIRIFAQVIIAIIGTICFAVILAAFSPETAKEFLNGMISGLPWCDPWVDLLSQFHSFDPANLTDIYIESFFQATIMGICMTVCKKIADFLKLSKILPFGKILVTAVGLAFGSFLCTSFTDQEGIALIAVGLIIVYGLLLAVRSIIPIPGILTNILSLKDILIIFINSLVAIILVGYIATLFLFAGGKIIFNTVIQMGIITAISLLILYTVDGFGT